MKRVWILLLACLMAAVFCACGNETASGGEEATESVMMSYVLGPVPEDGLKTDAISLINEKAILEKRLAGTGLTYSVTLDEAMNRLNVTCPDSLSTDLLTRKGVLGIVDSEGVLQIGNSDVKSATPKYDDQNSNYYVALVFTDDGAKKFEDMTRASVGKKTEVYLDRDLLCSPTVYAPIATGDVDLLGDFTEAQAITYANLMNADAMGTALEIISSQPAE